MTENDFILLLQLYSHRHLNENDITNQLTITKSQLVYRISKINDWLMRHQFSQIQRKSKRLVFDSALSEYIENLDFANLQISHLDQDSRLVLIFMIIAISKEAISLDHLAQYVSVSKNTILMDIKLVRKELKDFKINFSYSRSTGYTLEGSEFDIRRFVEFYIDKLSNTHVIINEISVVEPRIEILIDNYQNLMFHIENELKIRYSDRAMEIAPLYFYIIDQRISKGNGINLTTPRIFTGIVESEEYTVLERISNLYFYSYIDEFELGFLTLYLLSINKIDRDEGIQSLEKQALHKAIAGSMELFENKAALSLKNKEELVSKLSIHLSAAFYRYRYAIRSPYPIEISNEMRKDLEEISYFVSQSLHPLESLMDMKLPKDEVFFIASYIGGHIRANASIRALNMKNVKAIVICENGLVYSNIMINSLRQIFPEINFLGVMSIREFNQKNEDLEEVDIVFSSTYISTEKNLVVVNSFNTEEESRVIKEVNEIMKRKGFYGSSVVSDVMALIPNELTQEARIEMRLNLEKYFEKELEDEKLKPIEYSLTEKLTTNDIYFMQDRVSWKIILDNLGTKFVDENQFTVIDLRDFHNLYPEPVTEILFGGTILVPHLRIEGYQGFSMKLMILEDPIEIEGCEVYLIMMIVAGDDDSHVKAIYQLHQLSLDPQISKLYQKKNKRNTLEEIETILRHDDEKGNVNVR